MKHKIKKKIFFYVSKCLTNSPPHKKKLTQFCEGVEYPNFLVHFWTNERVFKRVNLSLRLLWTLYTCSKTFKREIIGPTWTEETYQGSSFCEVLVCFQIFVPLITYKHDPNVDLRDGRNSSVAF